MEQKKTRNGLLWTLYRLEECKDGDIIWMEADDKRGILETAGTWEPDPVDPAENGIGGFVNMPIDVELDPHDVESGAFRDWVEHRLRTDSRLTDVAEVCDEDPGLFVWRLEQ